MSISSSTRKAGPYSCNGSTVAFPFAFKVFTTADVRVVLTDANAVESDLVLGTNYTVALNADQDANPGGTVTTTTTYATGYLITLTSQVQNLQPVTLTNQGAFYPKVINDAFDRLTIMVQQVSEQVGRAVKVGISSVTSPDQLISTLLTAVSNALTYSNNASSSATAAAGSASAASASATAAAASAAALPNATGNADTVPVVNSTGTGWLMKTAAQMLTFLGLTNAAKTNVAQQFTAVQAPATGTATISATGTFSFNPATHGQSCTLTATNAITITLDVAASSLVAGAEYRIDVVAGDTSARTFAYNSTNLKMPGAAIPISSGSTVSGGVDSFTFKATSTSAMRLTGYVADVR